MPGTFQAYCASHSRAALLYAVRVTQLNKMLLTAAQGARQRPCNSAEGLKRVSEVCGKKSRDTVHVVRMSAVCLQDSLTDIKISLWNLIISKFCALKIDADTFSCIFYVNLFATFLSIDLVKLDFLE